MSGGPAPEETTMRTRRRIPFVGLGLATALALAMAGAVGTSADTAVTELGSRGVHYLADSAEASGVRCAYDDGNVIRSIRVRDPFVFGRNRTTSIDSQWVSWNFQVQAQTPGSASWTSVATSALQKRIASDAQIADFSAMTTAFAGSAAKQYRVIVVIRWFGSGGSPEVGRAVHRVDWYSWVGVPSFEGLCPGGIF